MNYLNPRFEFEHGPGFLGVQLRKNGSLRWLHNTISWIVIDPIPSSGLVCGAFKIQGKELYSISMYKYISMYE